MPRQIGIVVPLVNKLTAAALFCRRFLACPRRGMDERVTLAWSGVDGKEKVRGCGVQARKPPPSPSQLVRYSGALGSS